MKSTLSRLIRLTETATTLPTETGIPGLYMIKGKVPNHQLAALYKPMIGFTLQGTKILTIGEREVVMNGPSYFVLPLHVPATATVRDAPGGGIYTSLGLEIDNDIVQRLLRDMKEDVSSKATQKLDVCVMTEAHMDAWYRLLSLMTAPKDIPALSPVYTREIIYRVLQGPQGSYLRQIGRRESNFSKISLIVRWLRKNYMYEMDVKKLAEDSSMAINTFHRHFKQATGLSPIQFQKQLRLLEARNLIAFEGHAVASAAYEVGYQSPSQFNREYSRFFGKSPARDRAQLLESEYRSA